MGEGGRGGEGRGEEERSGKGGEKSDEREAADLVSHVMGIVISKSNSPQEVRVLHLQFPHLCSQPSVLNQHHLLRYAQLVSPLLTMHGHYCQEVYTCTQHTTLKCV